MHCELRVFDFVLAADTDFLNFRLLSHHLSHCKSVISSYEGAVKKVDGCKVLDDTGWDAVQILLLVTGPSFPSTLVGATFI